MIQAYGNSDIGRKRQRNEDSFAVNSDAQLFVVADGMGGHNAGDVASSTAVRTIESYMVRTHQERELVGRSELIQNSVSMEIGSAPL